MLTKLVLSAVLLVAVFLLFAAALAVGEWLDRRVKARRELRSVLKRVLVTGGLDEVRAVQAAHHDELSQRQMAALDERATELYLERDDDCSTHQHR